MANGFYITNAVAILGLDAIVDSVDTGAAPVIEIRDGSVPVDADATETGTLLVSIPMDTTAAFGASSDDTPGAIASADVSPVLSATAAATGTASYFRVKIATASTVRMQGTVGTSAADMILNTVAIVSLATVTISSFTILLPEGP